MDASVDTDLVVANDQTIAVDVTDDHDGETRTSLGEIAADDSDDDSDDESYSTHIAKMRLQKYRPAQLKPFLTEFIKFSELPTEIRHMIWSLTLSPRTIDLRHTTTRGFWTPVELPVALRVCQDSRNAVIKKYPVCFGNILSPPTLRFNFSLDTLYFDWSFQDMVHVFIASMSDHESKYIESIAVHRHIEDCKGWGLDYVSSDDAFDLLQTATARMPRMKEILLVHEMEDDWHEHGWPHSEGPIELHDEFLCEWQDFVTDIHIDDEDLMSECMEIDDCDKLEKFDVPKKQSVWGWRPAKLSSESLFFW